MEKILPFPFQVSIEEALFIQKELKKRISLNCTLEESSVNRIGGIDVSYLKNGFSMAVAVVLSFPEFQLLEVQVGKAPASFPYIPGFLSFREGPAIEKALAQIKKEPQLWFFDGQGIAHPRGVGLASHIGVLFDLVSIGIAKKPLIGEFEPPSPEKGAYSPLYYQEKQVGFAVRTRKNVKPIYVSPGHKISLEGALRWALKAISRYRLPEPTRIAHQLSQKLKKEGQDLGPGNTVF
ncbi:deoxyribonuclease V [Thermatribacter velox]|uniref:Endonuclease V n=1 Tax=Thermatribacter velox TaxID=3039681 RepID=A0ABZ2YCZ9_9BACT